MRVYFFQNLTAGLFFILSFLSVPPARAQEAPPWKLNEHQGVFLLMSDIHLNPFDDPALVPKLAAAPVEEWPAILETSRHKPFPDYEQDPNYALLMSALEKANRLGVKYDYAILTGDYLSHHFKEAFQKYVGGNEKALKDFSTKTEIFVARTIQRQLSGVPVYFAVGNHDSECDNYRMSSVDDLWRVLAKEWATVASHPEAAKNFVHGGYYAVPHPILKDHEIAVLNSVFWAKKYEEGCGDNPGNPGDEEMAWLQKTLDAAKRDHKVVTLTMHLPPGINPEKAEAKTYWKRHYERAFARLLSIYGDVIDAGFAGHTHMDDFRVDDAARGNPLLFHICPGICQIDGNNPGFQVMLYDKKDGSFKDIATFIVPNLKANMTGQEAWSLEYTFDDAYGYTAYNSENLLSLAEKIKADPMVREKFDNFYSMKTPADRLITEKNWESFNCSRTHMDLDSFLDCAR